MSVTWLDRDRAREAAHRIAREMASEHPELIGVVLFGSIARGDAVPGSDIDLLLVLRDSELSFLDRLSRYSRGPAHGLAVEVLPYTVTEIARQESEPGIVRTALEEGEWVVGSRQAVRLSESG